MLPTFRLFVKFPAKIAYRKNRVIATRYFSFSQLGERLDKLSCDWKKSPAKIPVFESRAGFIEHKFTEMNAEMPLIDKGKLVTLKEMEFEYNRLNAILPSRRTTFTVSGCTWITTFGYTFVSSSYMIEQISAMSFIVTVIAFIRLAYPTLCFDSADSTIKRLYEQLCGSYDQINKERIMRRLGELPNELEKKQ